MALGVRGVDAVSVRAITATASSVGVVDVSWTRPTDATSNDDYAYQVSYRAGTSGLYTVVAVAKGITTTSLSGLTGGTTYTIVVEAIPTKGPQFASVGCSAYAATSSDACTAFTSAASTTVIAQEAPDAPTIASAEASSGQISLVFGAPNLRGSSLTGYEATCGSAVATGTVSPMTVTGLTNGISYTCTVKANSNQGFSAASSASEALVPSTTPDTMEKPSGTASDASATISWTAVAATDSVGVGTSIDDGGSAITGYEVAVYDSANTLTTSVNAAAGATSAVATGLTNGTNYTAKVRAKNTNGSGTFSEASTAFTPVSAGAGSVTVFTEPAGAVNGANFTTQPVAKIGTTSGRIVTASIASGAGTLSGTLSATTNTDGKATFTNLRITGTTGAFRLQFAAIGYQSALSGSFTLSAGAASQLAVSRQPVGGNSGSALSTQPIVRVADTGGNFTNTINKQVTASLFSGAGTLSGTVVATTNASGIATFTNLVITGSTGLYVLRFTDTTGGSALTAVSSNNLSITEVSSGGGGGGGGGSDDDDEPSAPAATTTSTTVAKAPTTSTVSALPVAVPKTALPSSAGTPVKLATLPSAKLIESVGVSTKPGAVTLLLDAPTLPPKTRVAQYRVVLRPVGKGVTITRTLTVSASGAPLQPSFSNISGNYRVEITVISISKKVVGSWKSPVFTVTKKKK
jgi:hypothetical protein